MATISRNDPCPCGSGEKYKKCCMNTGGKSDSRRAQIGTAIAVVVVLVAAVLAFTVDRGTALVVGAVGLGALGGYFLFTDPPPPRSGGNPGAINFGR